MPGLSVGNAADARLASGVTALLFDEPAVASIAILGGAPGVRDTALLEPEMTVERVDALVLSGGSAFGLDAMGGVQSVLRQQGRGFRIGDVTVPIVPGAILFDLVERRRQGLGRAAALLGPRPRRGSGGGGEFELGTAGAGFGATTANLKGGLGSASAVTSAGFVVGALVAANSLGQATIGSGPHFWAAPYERDGEFGGLGWPAAMPAGRARDAHQRRCAAEHHDRDRRDRREPDKSASQAPRSDGA